MQSKARGWEARGNDGVAPTHGHLREAGQVRARARRKVYEGCTYGRPTTCRPGPCPTEMHTMCRTVPSRPVRAPTPTPPRAPEGAWSCGPCR